jgi:uncharacterized phage-associated protein
MFRTKREQWMAEGHDVLEIANAFLIRGWDDDARLTHMHLQKFCYMAHGFSLALFDKPLTYNNIEAWDFGPVYPDLYDALKKYGKAHITSPIHENNWASSDTVKGDVVTPNLSRIEKSIIATVWSDYGEYEAFQLSALTHEDDTPWAEVYKPGKNVVITDKHIKRYFSELTSRAE